MRIIGLTQNELDSCLASINLTYDNNIEFVYVTPRNKRGDAFQLRLRVRDTKGPGAQFSTSNPFIGIDGRRTIQACWHVYRDFFQAVYLFNTEAKIRTPLANYENRFHFHDTYPATKHRSYNSPLICPTGIGTRCDCEE